MTLFPLPAQFCSCCVSLKSNQKAVHCFWHANATYCTFSLITMLVINMVHRCCSWVGMFYCFSPLAACIVLFGTKETRPKERSFWIRPSSGHLRLVLSAHCVQLYIVWGVTWTILTNHSKGSFLCLVLRIHWSMILVGVLSTHMA